jgi:hypothetical protein
MKKITILVTFCLFSFSTVFAQRKMFSSGNRTSGSSSSTTNSNPIDFITSGIVLSLDAGNSASYSGSGTSWIDLSGYNNHGTLTNNPTFSNGSFLFNGGNYVNIPHTTSIAPSTGLITVSTWFKATNTGSENSSIIFNKENEYELSAGGGFITYAFRPNWAWVGRTAFNINQWYQVTITYNQVYQKMYVNGVEVFSEALTGAVGNNNALDLRIGARGAPGAPGSLFTGYIPVLLIYNRALTAAEVLSNYNSQKSRFGL